MIPENAIRFTVVTEKWHDWEKNGAPNQGDCVLEGQITVHVPGIGEYTLTWQKLHGSWQTKFLVLVREKKALCLNPYQKPSEDGSVGAWAVGYAVLSLAIEHDRGSEKVQTAYSCEPPLSSRAKVFHLSSIRQHACTDQFSENEVAAIVKFCQEFTGQTAVAANAFPEA